MDLSMPNPRPQAAPDEAGPSCPSCGVHYARGSRFCAADGSRLQVAEPARRSTVLDLSHVLVAGRYLKLRTLGGGGQGQVLLVQDIQSGRVLALKEFHRDVDIAYCSREVEAASRIEDHTNIVKMFELHRDPQTQLAFITMEYIDGETLEDHLERSELPLADALSVLRQISHGLCQMHSKLLVHRDIKPANVMLCGEGDGYQVKLLDLGISKSLNPGAQVLTQPGWVIGTLDYAAPEQLRGETVTPAFDIYALGVVAHRLLAGRLPHEEPTEGGRPEIASAELEGLVARMIEEDPARRPQDMREVHRTLVRAERELHAQPQRGRAKPSPGQVPLLRSQAAAVGSRSGVVRPLRVPRRAALPRAVGAGLALAAAVATLYLSMRHTANIAPHWVGGPAESHIHVQVPKPGLPFGVIATP